MPPRPDPRLPRGEFLEVGFSAAVSAGTGVSVLEVDSVKIIVAVINNRLCGELSLAWSDLAWTY